MASSYRNDFDEIIELIVKAYILFFLGSICFFISTAFPQERLCGRQAVMAYRQLEMPAATKILTPTQTSEPITVGTPLEFVNVFNGGALVPATCYYVGEHAYIFVQDSYWDENGGPVDQSHVDRLGRAFDFSTPADSQRGIYELGIEAFGPVPDVDGDERIFIVILDIQRANVVGFFDQGVATQANPAWRRDAVYLDEYFVRRQAVLAHATLAHEFQHLIHWGQDPDEESWINEGLSGYAERVAGYPEADAAAVEAFLTQPDNNLTRWEGEAVNYGSTYLFMAFLAERYGAAYIRRLIGELRNGIFGIEAAFAGLGIEQNFLGSWGLWSVANSVATDALYDYEALEGRRVQYIPIEYLPLGPAQGEVKNQWGTINILFRTPGNIAVDITSEESSKFHMWAYTMRGGQGTLSQLALDALNQTHVDAVGIDSLALIIGRTGPLGGTFTVSARELVITAVEEGDRLVDSTRLEVCYPNPFNSATGIPFVLARPSMVELNVYDMLGQRVRRLRQGLYEAGHYRLIWDATDEAGKAVASGLYCVELKTGKNRFKQYISLIR